MCKFEYIFPCQSHFRLYSHFKKHVLAKLDSNSRPQYVLFPLCGKSVDMKAVLDVNHRVIGIECAQLGIEAFFNENNIAYQATDDAQNKCRIYQVFRNSSHFFP